MAFWRPSGRGMGERGPGVLIAFAAISVVIVAARLGWLEAAELAVFDRFVRTFAGQGTAQEMEGATAVASPARGEGSTAPAALLVSLVEDDFERHGYPIPDALLAEVLERLAVLGASAIGVDLYRTAPAGTAAEELAGWSALADCVARHPRIVMTELLPASDAPGMRPPPFAPAEQVGFNNVLVDPGRVVRRGYLYAWEDDGSAHVSLALRLASLHLARRGVAIGPDPEHPEAIRVGETLLAPIEAGHGAYVGLDAGGYQIPLDFRRDAQAFADLRLDDLLAGRLDATRVAGRIVVIGSDAPSVKDDFNTPLSPVSVVKGHRLHAQLADQLVRAGLAGDAPPRSVSDGVELALSLAFGLAALAIAQGGGSFGAVVPCLVAGLALPFVFAGTVFLQGSWVPSVTPALAWAAAGGTSFALRARAEARDRRQLVSLFRRFSSSKVADELWRERDAFMEGGRPRPRRVVLTALVSDLVGFTSAAEQLEPEALLAWIDGYMDAMTRVIEAHGGHVDDYAGDGIKANFGVPVPSETEEAIARDARAAVHCALAMGHALAECNREWTARGLPTARQRIGIETGPAVVGAIGSDQRMKYTSLGDTINVAARLESFADPGATDGEAWQARILVGDETRRRLGEAFRVEDLGSHALKGKALPVRIHRVFGEAEAGLEAGEGES